MSRVAKNPINIPDNVDLNVSDGVVKVKGSKGALEFELPASISLDIQENIITVKYDESNQKSIALGGTTRSLVNNMIIGVSEGYEKKLELIGVGYRAALKGKQLNLQLGYSHDINFEIPEGIKIEVEKQTILKISGFDKQLVGVVASKIKTFRKIEPYKGKGIREKGQYVLKKEGKKK